MQIIKCGACIGCETEAFISKSTAEIDAVYLPKITEAYRRLYAARDRERGCGYPADFRPAEKQSRRELRRVIEQRQAAVNSLLGFARICGCWQPTIKLDAGESFGTTTAKEG